MVALELERGVVAELLARVAQAEVLVLVLRQLVQVVLPQLRRLRAQQHLRGAAPALSRGCRPAELGKHRGAAEPGKDTEAQALET